MSYTTRKKEKRVSWTERLIILAVIVLTAGTIFYSISIDRSEASNTARYSDESEGGIIATSLGNGPGAADLHQNNPAVAGQTTEEQPPESTVTTPRFSLQLPDGWIEETSTTVANPCDPTNTQQWSTVIYTNESETITIFENGDASDCSNGFVADVDLEYSYNETGDSLVVDDGIVTFCDATTPNCPKGDGKVSVTIASKKIEDETDPTPNPLSGNNYIFRIIDTRVDSDLTKQVQDLVDIIEEILFF